MNFLGKVNLRLTLSLMSAYGFGVIYLTFWTDDFAGIADNQANSLHMIKDTRPFGALLLYITFEIVKFNFLFGVAFKLLGLIGIIALGHYLLNNLVSSRVSRSDMAVIISIGLCLPAFQVQAHWLHMWLSAWLVLASLLSYKSWILGRRFRATVLLACVFLTYPPMAFWIFTFGGLAFFLSKEDSKKGLRDLSDQIILFLFGFMLSRLMSLLVTNVLDTDVNERVDFVSFTDAPTKLIWYMTRPLVTAFRPFMIDSPSEQFAFVTALPFILLFFGLLTISFVSRSTSIKEKFNQLFLFSLWIMIFSSAHILVTSNNQFEFRMVSNLHFGILFFILSGLVQIRLLRGVSKKFLLILLLVISISTVNFRYYDLMFVPFKQKNEFIKNELMRCNSDDEYKGVQVIKPTIAFPMHDRLGDFSIATDLSYSWVLEGSIIYVLESEKFRRFSDSPIQIDNKGTNNRESFCTVDLNDFQKELSSHQPKS